MIGKEIGKEIVEAWEGLPYLDRDVLAARIDAALREARAEVWDEAATIALNANGKVTTDIVIEAALIIYSGRFVNLCRARAEEARCE
jgi:hypothetical protein